MVDPQWLPPRDTTTPMRNPFLSLNVQSSTTEQFLLVLIVVADRDGCPRDPGVRKDADDRVRQQFSALLGKCALPRLWGLSLIGTSLRVYCAATGSLRPGDAPGDLWDGEWEIDITSQEGFDKTKEIAGDIFAQPAL